MHECHSRAAAATAAAASKKLNTAFCSNERGLSQAARRDEQKEIFCSPALFNLALQTVLLVVQ